MNPTPTPTPAPCPPPGSPDGCYECPPGSGQVVCIDSWEYVPPVPTLSEWGLVVLTLALAVVGLRKVRA